MRTALLVVLALALSVMLVPLAEAGGSAATSAAKKCKSGFVKKTVKTKRNGKTVRVKKCVRKKKTAAPKIPAPKIDPDAVLPGLYNGTTSQGIKFQASVSRRGSYQLTVSILVTCTDAAGVAQQSEVSFKAGGATRRGILKGQLFARLSNGSVASAVIRGDIRGGKLDASSAAESLRTCEVPAITLKGAI